MMTQLLEFLRECDAAFVLVMSVILLIAGYFTLRMVLKFLIVLVRGYPPKFECERKSTDDVLNQDGLP